MRFFFFASQFIHRQNNQHLCVCVWVVAIYQAKSSWLQLLWVESIACAAPCTHPMYGEASRAHSRPHISFILVIRDVRCMFAICSGFSLQSRWTNASNKGSHQRHHIISVNVVRELWTMQYDAAEALHRKNLMLSTFVNIKLVFLDFVPHKQSIPI